MISEIKQRHSNQPISQDQYNKWRRMNVTKRLFEEIELSVLDSYLDYLSTDSVDQVALISMVRQGASEMVEKILDWAPAGVTGPNDKEPDDEKW